MPFAVEDFQDLLRLLDQHPEWQAELRRRVLTEELIELPALVRGLTEGQTRTDKQIAALAEQLVTLTSRVDALTSRVDALAEQLAALTSRVDALTSRIDRLTEQVTLLVGEQRHMASRLQLQTERLDAAIGDLLEFRYERRAGAYFSQLAKKIKVVDRSALADLLDDAVDEGRIAEGDRNDVLHADLVLTGQRREDRVDVYLVAEVSVGIGVDDVLRADDRASVMARLGRPAIAVVAGQRIDPEPAELARARGVRQILDGHGVRPVADVR